MEEEILERNAPAPLERLPAVLPSGRRLSLVQRDHWEELRIVSPDGEIELAVELTPQGPLLRLRGARLEIDSTGSVAVRCRSFELRTEARIELSAGGGVAVASEGEIRMKSADETFIDGDFVNLNCLDRSGYHDDPAVRGDSAALPAPAGAGEGIAESEDEETLRARP